MLVSFRHETVGENLLRQVRLTVSGQAIEIKHHRGGNVQPPFACDKVADREEVVVVKKKQLRGIRE
jgi:hypothetical protein